jgi:putative ABC transport system permease protein
MPIPIVYNLRSLAARKTTTAMTALGLGVSVAILLASLALVSGLRTVFRSTAHPLDLLVLRNGSNSELGSGLPQEAVAVLRAMPGVALDRRGEPLVSAEVVQVVSLPSVDHPNGTNVTVRGLTSTGIAMRNVHLREGVWFRPGRREIAVGKAVARRYPVAQVAERIRFGADDWEVAGVMDAEQSVVNSEIWGDLDQVNDAYNRRETVSSVLVRAADSVALEPLRHAIDGNRRLGATAVTEQAYYERMTAAGRPLELLGIVVAAIMALGSGFAAMNTMYAAVARRAREIGTLRTLGFSRGSILLSFLVESVLLSILAGILGSLLALPLNWVTTRVGSFVSFSEIAFRFHVGIGEVVTGVMFAAVLGVFGGILPARAAARKEILSALREG